MSDSPDVAKGDIVQITDEHDPWFGMLLIVEEPKSFGFQGFFEAPALEASAARYYRRLDKNQYTTVGHIALKLPPDE